MNELSSKLRSEVRAVWKRRWIAVGVAWVTALLCGVGSTFVPNRYEATAKLFVDTQSVLKPLMAGLAFQPDLDQQVRMLGRTLVSRNNIERLLKDPLVGSGIDGDLQREKAIEKLTKGITVDHSGGNLYVISYKDTAPLRAKAVVAALVNLFVSTGNDSKARDSEEARQFIDAQIKIYEVKLSDSENRLKDFKLKNFGVSGVSNQDYFARTSTLSEEVGKLRMNLAATEQSRDALKRELSSEDPQLPPDLTVNVATPPPVPTEVDARLDAQRRQLDDLLRRYTEDHPDVLAARRIIAQLDQQKRQQEDDARAKAQSVRGPARSSGNNPVYQRLRIAFAEAEANVASIRSQLQGQQNRLDLMKATASKVPQAEADLTQLNRDYDIMRKQYEQLVSRREAASLGVKIDESQNMAEYRVIDPPRVPANAVFPDRRLLAAAGALLAIVAGVASAIGLSRMLPTIETRELLEALVKRPVLGTVSWQLSDLARGARRADVLRLGGVLFAFVLANVVWISW